MCDLEKFLTRAFTPAGVGAAAENDMIRAKSDANDALLAQKQAQDAAANAADTGSETVRLASEARMRKLTAAGAFGAVAPPSMGAAPVAYRQLFGG